MGRGGIGSWVLMIIDLLIIILSFLFVKRVITYKGDGELDLNNKIFWAFCGIFVLISAIVALLVTPVFLW